MSYLYTGSTQSGATNTGLSTQILVKVDGQAVGAIQQLTTNEDRSIKPISEVGTDGFIEKVPQSATGISLTINRLVYDRKSVTEAFNRGFLHISSQRLPFDIFIYDYSGVSAGNLDDDFDAANEQGVITTVYENCWFRSKSTTYSSSDYVITQSANIEAEFAHSFVDGNPQANASAGTPDFDDPLERLADTSRRGSLDARGLARVNDIFGVFQG